jgi:hypothetical protein
MRISSAFTRTDRCVDFDFDSNRQPATGNAKAAASVILVAKRENATLARVLSWIVLMPSSLKEIAECTAETVSARGYTREKSIPQKRGFRNRTLLRHGCASATMASARRTVRFQGSFTAV